MATKPFTVDGNIVVDDATLSSSISSLVLPAGSIITGGGTVLDATNSDTDDLTEGVTNLYFTDTRADARIALQAGSNLDLSGKSTTDLSEGTNLYYTDTRADARIALQAGANLDLSSKSTTDLAEGTNLYYTDVRADARIAAASITDLSDADQSVQTTDNVTFANITATGYIAGPATFTIDPSAVGDNTGTVVIAGNLQVDGTTTTINSTTVAIDDLKLSVATDAADSAAANGAGITVGGANANITYTHATTSWDFDKPVNVAGNLGVTGTVDGVDIAARDAILTSTTTTAGAALPKAGGIMTGDLSLEDNTKIQLGASNDLEIYHDGSNSYIHDRGVGNLYVKANVFRVYNSAETEIMANFVQNSAVSLYHDATKKFETTATGINVTGDIGVSGTVDGVDIATRDAVLTSTTTTAGAALPKAGGTITGTLNIDVADLFVKDTTGGAQGQVQIGAGTAQGFINIQKGDGTRNVQLSSDGDTYFNGGNVGIGTDSPASTLDTGYTRIYNSGAASSPSSGKGLEVHYVTSGRTQGEGAYLIPYDRDNGQYKPLTIDAITTRLLGGNTLIGPNSLTDSFTASQRLHVYDPSTAYILAETGGTGTSAGHRSTAGSNDWVWFATEGQPNYRLYDYSSSAVRLTVKNDGNVGIGTDAPTARLDVRRGDADGKIAEFHQNTGYGIDIGSSQSVAYISSGYNQRLDFKTDPTSGQTERMSILANGNVGIGETNPSARLDVVSNSASGYVAEFRESNASNFGTIVIDSPSDGESRPSYMDYATGGTVKWSTGLAYLDAARSFHIGTGSGTSNSKVTINTSGNVGIGTTDPSYAKLHIINSTGGGNDNFMLMLQNTTTVADSRSGIMFSTNSGQGPGRDGAAIQASNNGIDGKAHINFGNVINNVYEEKVRFTTDGKVGIGTATPPATLSIYGNEATGMGISIHDDGWGGANGLYMMTVQNSNGAFVVRKNTANALDFSTSENQMEVGTDGIRAIGYGNSATGDNVSVEYTGTAGGHKSGYLFRDKRDVVNAAVKNNLLDDGVGTTAAELQLYTSHGGTLTKQMNIDRYGYIDTTNPRLTVGSGNYNARTGKTGVRVGRTVYNWFNYGSQSSARYLHIKTNLANLVGSNPEATMSMFHIRGYTYATENIDSMLGFHNWSGSYYNTAYTNNGHRTVVSSSWAPYRSTDNKVVIVLDLGSSIYAGVSIDYMQNFEYTWRDVEVSTYTRSTNTSGVY